MGSQAMSRTGTQGDGFLQAKQQVVLIVEDDAALRNLILDELWDEGFRVIEACDGREALSQLETSFPDVVITDLRMPAGGFDYLRKLKTVAFDCPVILITAFGDSRTKAEALQCGVAVYLDKPVRMTELKGAIRQVLGVGQIQDPEHEAR